MRKIIISIYSVLLFSMMTIQNAYALFGVGDIVFDPAAQGTRIVQLAKEVLTVGTTMATQINTWNTALKITILDPLGNAMIAVSLLKQQSNTINLVTGSLGGGNSLLIANPQQWIQNQGLNAVRISLGDLNKQDGPYTNSILNNVVTTFRSSNRSLDATLANINTSSIPSTVKNNLCNDSTLTKVAQNDVTKNDGTFDPADVAQRKREIYNSLCTCDPKEAQCAKKLEQVNSLRPDIGGWDTLFAETPYEKNVRATLALNQKVEENKAAARDDLNRGGGIASPSKCKTSDKANNDQNGEPVLNIADTLCRAPTISNTGNAINASFQAAINAPMQRLSNSFGSGILGTLSTLLAARNTIGMLSNAFDGISATGGVNSGSIVSASTTPAQDLVGNPNGKKAVADPGLRRLAAYSDALDKLQAADDGVRVEASLAQGTNNQIKSCYQGLMTDFNINTTYPGVGEALSYADSQNQKLNTLLSKTAQDAILLATARRGVADTQTAITNSNSSEEISNIYSDFEEKVANGTYPGDSFGMEREGDYQSLKAENQTETMQGGTAYRLQNQCSTIRQQLTPRDNGY